MTVRNYDYSWLPKGYTLFVEVKGGYSDPREGTSPDSVYVQLKDDRGKLSKGTYVLDESGRGITSAKQINDRNLTLAFDRLRLAHKTAETVSEYLGTHPRP